MTTARHLVVVAVAESESGDALVEKLRTTFTVRTAYDWEGLSDSLDEAVDVVLFDPDLPGVDPETLADRIQSRDLDCRVGVFTSGQATEPPGIADAVLDETAPVAELEAVVARMAARAAYQRCLERLYDLATRRADLLTDQAGAPDSEAGDELDRIEARIGQLRAEIDDVLDRLDDEAAFETALEHLDEGSDEEGRGDGDRDGHGHGNREC